jgi:hypothetical protein
MAIKASRWSETVVIFPINPYICFPSLFGVRMGVQDTPANAAVAPRMKPRRFVFIESPLLPKR